MSVPAYLGRKPALGVEPSHFGAELGFRADFCKPHLVLILKTLLFISILIAPTPRDCSRSIIGARIKALSVLPPRVQKFVTLRPIKTHNVLKDWIESIEIQCSSILSLDPSLI